MSTEMDLIVADTGHDRRPAAVVAAMPVMDMDTALERWEAIRLFVAKIMTPGEDFGAIPGAGSKPVLLKPGAEKLASFFGLAPEFDVVRRIEEWDAKEPFFAYEVKARLIRDGVVRGEGLGSCNSRESKFRWRQAERKCPKCGAQAIIRCKSEYGGGWLCFAKRGGCGAKYQDGDARIEGQATGRIPNPDIADQVNTILKMSKKRALIDAVLNTVGASQFFTQDAEDAPPSDVPAAAPPEPANPAPGQEEEPWDGFRGMIQAFAKLHARLPPGHDRVYQEILAQFGVKHSNQFKDLRTAWAAYRALEAKVRELEQEAGARDPEPKNARRKKSPARAGVPLDDQVAPKLQAILARMTDRDSIAKELSHLLDELSETIGDERGESEFTRLLAKYGAQGWQDLRTVGKAREFAGDVFRMIQAASSPSEKTYTPADDDVPDFGQAAAAEEPAGPEASHAG
jgi:hypothetical protein